MMTTSRGTAILSSPLYVLQNFEGRQTSIGTHNSPSGMGGRAAHVQILDRRAVSRPSGHRAQEEKLFQRKFALEDVSFTQSPLALQVEGGYDLAVQDNVFDV